jgi:O-methyltransferase involved in polyketide biosynthesis
LGTLQAVPFQYSRPIAVVTEGLLGYLTRQEKRTLATNIRELFAPYSGIWITPDVGTQQLFKRFSQVDGDVQQRFEYISSATGRDIEKNAFEEDDDLRRFFSDAGYTIEEYPHANVLDDLSAVKLTQPIEMKCVSLCRCVGL